jgi:hypothetical protein
MSGKNGSIILGEGGRQRCSRQIVCSSSGDQNLSRDRHVLHRQPLYCSVAVVRTGCQAGTWRHQQSGEGVAHSNGKEQLTHCFFMGGAYHSRMAYERGGGLNDGGVRVTQSYLN